MKVYIDTSCLLTWDGAELRNAMYIECVRRDLLCQTYEAHANANPQGIDVPGNGFCFAFCGGRSSLVGELGHLPVILIPSQGTRLFFRALKQTKSVHSLPRSIAVGALAGPSAASYASTQGGDVQMAAKTFKKIHDANSRSGKLLTYVQLYSADQALDTRDREVAVSGNGYVTTANLASRLANLPGW